MSKQITFRSILFYLSFIVSVYFMIKILGHMGTISIRGGIIGSLFFILMSLILPGFPILGLIITLIHRSDERVTKILQWVSVISIILFVIIVKALGGQLP